MNPDLVAIFDHQAHFRATLAWVRDEFVLNGLPGFDNKDIEAFLSDISTHDPRQRIERDKASYLVSTSKGDPDYRNAVWQELEIRGFVAYPIEEYQKGFLTQLNGAEFNNIRKVMLGDLLSLSEEEERHFVENFKEGVAIINEIRELEK